MLRVAGGLGFAELRRGRRDSGFRLPHPHGRFRDIATPEFVSRFVNVIYETP